MLHSLRDVSYLIEGDQNYRYPKTRPKNSYPAWTCTCFAIFVPADLRRWTETDTRMRTAAPIQLQLQPHFVCDRETLGDTRCKTNGSKIPITHTARSSFDTFPPIEKLRTNSICSISTMPDALRPVKVGFYLVFNSLSIPHVTLTLTTRLVISTS